MGKSNAKAKKQSSMLSLALLNYYDEFAEFNEDCAFLCDAFACLVDNQEILDQYTIRGFENNAHWLKQRTKELKEKLKQIRELHSAECD